MMKAGLIGEKLGHSISPKIHEFFYEHTGIPGSYELFEIRKDGLDQALNRMAENGCYGVNVTIPYKQDVVPLLDQLSQKATRIGAVNTIRFHKGKRYGYNTDYFGLEMLFDDNGIQIKDKKAVILGWGGAARCAETLLIDRSAGEIYIVSRTPPKVRAQSAAISYTALKQIKNIDILVNTTPVGMSPGLDACPVPDTVIKNSKNVVDIIYNPVETRLLKNAKKLDKKSVNGLRMLVGQAVKAQEIWNGLQFGDDVVNAVYNRILEEWK